ncbi:MAG: hypothetical protein GDA67_13755 [Nitrospira sp. CR1.3]|nr:hypothetical protein [Nitrospira sp. CR1.3]
MLKITKTDMDRSRVVFTLEGKITGQWADLLDAECRAELRNLKSIELNCAGVDFVDGQGVEVLKQLSRKRVTILKAPGYMTDLMDIGGRS